MLVLIMQVYIAIAAGIVIENLIHGISLAFAGSLAEIHRSHIGACIAEQGIAENEEIVHSLVTAGYQRTTIGWLALVGGLHHRHAGCASLYPYKLPVVIEIVSQEFTRLECSITESTLGRYRSIDQKQQHGYYK